MYQVVGGVGAAVFLVMVGSHVLAGTIAAPFFVAYYMYYSRMREDTVTFGDFITDMAELRAGTGLDAPLPTRDQVHLLGRGAHAAGA